jgi:hypothetical protein
MPGTERVSSTAYGPGHTSSAKGFGSEEAAAKGKPSASAGDGKDGDSEASTT